MAKVETIFTKTFFVLNAVTFLVFSNVAIFFNYYEYLKTMPISPQGYGILIGVFSLIVLLVRPILSLVLTGSNSRAWIAASGVLLIISMVLYDLATSFWSMFLVRIIHGAAYAAIATAILTLFVGTIPKEKSGQAFAWFSVVTLLPYAVIPPVMEPLTIFLGGFDRVLDFSGLVLVLVFPLIRLLDSNQIQNQGGGSKSPTLREIVQELRRLDIIILLTLSVLVWTAFTPVFFFLQAFGKEYGISNAGFFFTLSTFAEIAVRVAGGGFFDKLPKAQLLTASCAWLFVCYILLANIGSFPGVFFMLGFFFGIGWGVAMPLLSGLIFDVSSEELTAFNSNLGMQMFQMGFFLGPSIGGMILVHTGYSVLYYVCAGVIFLGMVLSLLLICTRTHARI